jgi:hypothetical protein
LASSRYMLNVVTRAATAAANHQVGKAGDIGDTRA